MKNWNTVGNVRGFGIALGVTMSVAASAAMADGAITMQPFSGPVAGAPAPESLLTADFEGVLPAGLGFLPAAPAVTSGNSIAPGNNSAMLGSWDPFVLPAVQVTFDPAALGGVAPRFAAFVVTESAGLGIATPITITAWFADGTSETTTLEILSAADDSNDDVLVRVDSALGIAQISINSVIPISIDNVMYETGVQVPPARFVQDDVNGDGISETAWYRARRLANIWYWTPSSFTEASPECAAPTQRATVVGLGDADGNKKADILWQDSRTGAIWVWLLGGLEPNELLVDRNVRGWRVIGFTDVNGDKRADIMLRRLVGSTTEVRMLALNGATVTSDVTSKFVGQYDQAFVGDLNRDGRAELILKQRRAARCGTELYFTSTLAGDVNGTGGQFTAPARLRDTSGQDELPLDRRYVIAGIADMTGDGAADIIFRHSSGDVVVWDIDDSKVTSKTVLAQRATGFTIVGFPDIDGDNVREVLLRNKRDDVKTWKLSGSAVIESSRGKAPKTWAPAAPAK
jgi:hypothetical protein